MKKLRLASSPLTGNVYVGETKEDRFVGEKVDVTEDFKRCVVYFSTEVKEFDVDGMKFRTTCERID